MSVEKFSANFGRCLEHTSIGLPSFCTLDTVSAYWLNGTLPKPGKVCHVDKSPYLNVTWEDIFVKASMNKTSLT